MNPNSSAPASTLGSAPAPAPAFADSAGQQPIFRALLGALSYPGRLHTVAAPAGVADVVVTLVDRQVSLADPYAALPKPLWRWLGIAPEQPDAAQYIVCPAQDSPDFQPAIGSLESPEFGATIIIPVPELTAISAWEADALYVAGPSRNSPKVRGLRAKGLNPQWLSCRAKWHRGFPLGTDWFFVAPSGDGQVAIAAVPRSCAVVSDWDQLKSYAAADALAGLNDKKERLDP